MPKSSLKYRDFVGRGGVDSVRNGVGTDSIFNMTPAQFITIAYQNGTVGFININELDVANTQSNLVQTSPIPTKFDQKQGWFYFGDF